ncbi:B-cell CLL/lymphoma 6 member B protein isoform X2 [Rhineura floridana]|uniref:B-cell CLL/lymphoma 6 member B protein isoform X2 n=1 Tax=Rhineura floridana TaxID=261503 RepID=UPI002AC880A9|nr:B-cell CLL/lymphoma 6 member B protein isoform X2 [Rhineura floridana]
MAGPQNHSYVCEFTRHSSDVLMNLNELRKRHILTDVTLQVGGCPLQAHKAVLTACSGFFYSIFLGQGGHEVSVLSLPSSIEPAGFQALLDFMYTSRLLLTPGTVPALLAAASYLQMEHVVESCHRFIQASYDRVTFLLTPPTPNFPRRKFQPLEGEVRSVAASFPRQVQEDATIASTAASPFPGSYCLKEKELGSMMSPGAGDQSPPGQPASPRESSSCAPIPDPKACNWKKYRFIVLNSMLREGRQDPPKSHSQAGSNGDSGKGSHLQRLPTAQAHCSICNQPTPPLCSHPPEDVSMGQGDPSGTGASPYDCKACDLAYLEGEEGGRGGGRSPPPAGDVSEEKPHKCHFCSSAFRYKGSLASHRSLHTGEKPYRCGICGAQFNRPANLKTHLRIHSGEKPYKCETCGSRFVQVAHLRAHILIHTGEKPYPCGTCGTRFRHLQTLKSHIRIHTGEKPYHCEKCSIHFRHKSQLRLHLRQKHGAITNTKIRYQVLNGPYATLC